MFAATVFISLLAAVSAVPTSGHNTQNAQACGNGGTVHCCNQESASKLTNPGSLLSGFELNNLVGPCNDITATVIGAAVPINDVCKQQAYCCQNVNQNGLVNVACSPIDLL